MAVKRPVCLTSGGLKELASADVLVGGATAWAKIDADGNLLAAVNVASAAKTATGKYKWVFETELSSANYSVSITPDVGSLFCNTPFTLQTTTQGEVYFTNWADTNINTGFYVTITGGL